MIMLNVLLRKQFAELFNQMFRKSAMGKSGKSGKGRTALYILLFAYLFAMMAFLFYSMSGVLCAPLYEAGLGWLYFALIGIMATALGVVGSVFTTYSSLYQAKDNELLLSMPIPPRVILASRMVMVYLLGFVFEAVVWIPAVLQYFRAAGFTAGSAIAGLVLLFLLPLLALVLSCILGWVIAVISARIPHNRGSIIIVILSLAFIAVYYYVCTKAYAYLQLILINSEAISAKIKAFLYPFYQMGYGAQGQFSSLLLFSAMLLAAFAVVELILSRSFIKLTTTRRGAAKVIYKEKAVTVTKPDAALLRKEFMRFTGSSTYMLNCGLGAVFTLVIAVFAVIKGDLLREVLSALPTSVEPVIPLILCALLASLSSMNTLTAPSISLEGNSLWLLQSLPVSPWQVLKAKLKLHLLVSGIPTFLCALVLVLVLQPGAAFGILIPVFSLLFVVLCAVLGLLLNLRFPALNYTNETAAVKQGLSVALGIFIPWGILVVFCLIYLPLHNILPTQLYLLLVILLTAAASALMLRTLMTKGAQRFQTL